MKTDVQTPGETAAEPGRGVPGTVVLQGFAIVGALVALSLGIYGRVHTPTGRPLALLVGFTGLTPMKAWLATAAVVLAVFQVVSAMWMYGRLPIKRKPISGGLLFALLIGAWATAGLWYLTQSGVPLRWSRRRHRQDAGDHSDRGDHAERDEEPVPRVFAIVEQGQDDSEGAQGEQVDAVPKRRSGQDHGAIGVTWYAVRAGEVGPRRDQAGVAQRLEKALHDDGFGHHQYGEQWCGAAAREPSGDQ
jgi:hypothetical protein